MRGAVIGSFSEKEENLCLAALKIRGYKPEVLKTLNKTDLKKIPKFKFIYLSLDTFLRHETFFCELPPGKRDKIIVFTSMENLLLMEEKCIEAAYYCPELQAMITKPHHKVREKLKKEK